MHASEDTYRIIARPSGNVLFKDRKSKFYGHAFPLEMEADVKPIVERLKRQYPTANHFCYAWQMGTETKDYRANDDGEPKNSAGMPIYGQIQSYQVTNVLIVVVRIFGGAKLGVSGLINAYKTTAQMVLERATIENRSIEAQLKLNFDYTLMNDVMRWVKKWNIRIVSQQMDHTCSWIIAVPKSKTTFLVRELGHIRRLEIALL